MQFEKELDKLEKAGVLDSDTRIRIESYYAQQPDPSGNRLILAFAILGGLLVGLGILLLVAHNWDSFSKSVRLLLAGLPLLISQGICFWALRNRAGNPRWLEPCCTLVVFSLGACIALVSQIYHIPGTMESFLLVWMAGSLPLVYVLPAFLPALLILLGSTVYAVSGLMGPENSEANPQWYWVFFLALLPHYTSLIRKAPNQLQTNLHHAFVAVSIGISFLLVMDETEILMAPAYMGLGALYLVWGHQSWFSIGRRGRQIFSLVGAAGILGVLLSFTYHGVWDSILRHPLHLTQIIQTREGLVSGGLFLLVCAALFLNYSAWQNAGHLPVLVGACLFFLLFWTGQFVYGMVVNLVVSLIALWTLWVGAKKGSAGQMNLGLGLASVLIGLRFLDSDLSFEVRGILFIALGLGFFLANYLWIGKRKKNG
jgi:uncharacterized membrane protein